MKQEQIEKEIDARLEEPDNNWDGIFNSGYSRGFREGAQWLVDRLCHLPLDKVLQELAEYINQKEETK